MKRRDFGKTGAAGVAAAITGCSGETEKVVIKPPAKEEAPKPYGIQYYDKAYEIWERISTSELPLIEQAADQAVSSLRNGGKIYCQITGGHMHMAELRPDRAGNPDYLHNWNRYLKPEQFEVVGDGDFMLFDSPYEHIRKARDRGAFTVGITVAYFPNKTTPKGVLAMNELAVDPVFEDVILLDDCSSIVLTSGVPFTDGILFIPEIPVVRPSGINPQGTHNFYWMLTAEIAARDKGGGAKGPTGKACEYIELIKERGAKIRADFDNIDAIAKAMVGYVSNGGRYWNFPLQTKKQSWTIMVTENTGRASGLTMINLIEPKDIPENLDGYDVSPLNKGKAGDFVFIASEASDVKGNIEAAKAFKKAGFIVIYIGPAKTEGSTGDDIVKYADWHIDTYSPEREGAITIPGFERKLCPTTGVLYPLAQYMLNSQFIGHMIEADMTPLVNMGFNLIGGRVYYDLIHKIYEKRGY